MALKFQFHVLVRSPSLFITSTAQLTHPDEVFQRFALSDANSLSMEFSAFLTQVVVINFTFYLPSRLGQETAKGRFGLQVKLPPVCHS